MVDQSRRFNTVGHRNVRLEEYQRAIVAQEKKCLLVVCSTHVFGSCGRIRKRAHGALGAEKETPKDE